ncbi:hypothetical protein DCC62_02960 [candidate division KSB1 bacterium]|nr:MAG: hypothetical protein DCC62_02960 [candidate division KSB1 bacterium]
MVHGLLANTLTQEFLSMFDSAVSAVRSCLREINLCGRNKNASMSQMNKRMLFGLYRLNSKNPLAGLRLMMPFGGSAFDFSQIWERTRLRAFLQWAHYTRFYAHCQAQDFFI